MSRCYELHGPTRFEGRASIYARSRPSYPSEAISAVLERLGDPARLRAVDLGAGTGISTRLMAERGLRVVALDPNLGMLRAAAPHAGMSRLLASAETLPLPDGSLDLLTAFNAFHWFQPEAALTEFARVLRVSGRLALIWNDWDLRDRFTSEFFRLMRSHASDYPPEDREAEVAPLYASSRFSDIRRSEFPYVQRLDFPTLTLRLQSMSYIPLEGTKWEAIFEELAALHARYAGSDGVVSHRYTTAVFVARREA